MIKDIICSLNANQAVTDWLINETISDSTQAFYVMQKLETTRKVQTIDYTITVYHRFSEADIDYMGSSSFVISHKLSAEELNTKIANAVFAASFIKNKSYDLVVGEKIACFEEKPYQLEANILLDKIAQIFISQSSEVMRFNALELFHNKTTTHIINSKNVDLTKTLFKVEVEGIPSYDGEDQKVELYNYFTYTDIDYETIINDAKNALDDVLKRYRAQQIKDISKIDVLLKDRNVHSFFQHLIRDYSYSSVYRQTTDKKIGDAIQKDVEGDLITINYQPSSKANLFDKDGVLLEPINIIKDGVITNYYGDHQHAQYLNMKPSGILDLIDVLPKDTPYQDLAKGPHLEIIALSGIQIDLYSGYIGGEVRLAMYYDGSSYTPVSGFSFSGNIMKCLSHLTLSKETVKLPAYYGPKYIKLIDMDVL